MRLKTTSYKKIKKGLTNSTVSGIIKIQRKNKGLKGKATEKVQKNKKKVLTKSTTSAIIKM